jgi:hypothetical protein|tara:strand:+ start:834 stop:1421 length:588 start_codon:yes stop_codon:yes gene_type:complete
MKKLSAYLFLILFCFSAPSFADDISDFQIEELAIGDSLLNIFSKEEIDSIEPTYYPDSRKFHDLPIVSHKFKDYDQVSFGLKRDDEKYIIYSLSGDLYYENDFKNCMKKKEEILKEATSLFTKQKRSDYRYVYSEIDDGKSFSETTDFIFKDKSRLRIYCTDWTLETERKREFSDMLSVNAVSYEYLKWLNKEAY